MRYFWVILAIAVILAGCAGMKINGNPGSEIINTLMNVSALPSPAAASSTQPPATASEATSPPRASAETSLPAESEPIPLPAVYYYYSSTCSASKEAAPLIAEIKAAFAGKMDFYEYNILNKTGMQEYDRFALKNNITTRYVPMIVIGNRTLTGLGEIKRENLYSALFEYLNVTPEELLKSMNGANESG